MTREQWLAERRSGMLSTLMFWEYYKEKREGELMDESMFNVAMQMFMGRFNIQLVHERIVRHFDNKFSLVSLTDKTGNLICIN